MDKIEYYEPAHCQACFLTYDLWKNKYTEAILCVDCLNEEFRSTEELTDSGKETFKVEL